MSKQIAITGLARSGKDTLAGFLSEELNQKTYALADPIKKLLAALFNVPLERFYDEQYKSKRMTYTIDISSLEDCGMLYNELGLDSIQEFHDAWDMWIPLLDLRYDDESYRTVISIRQLMQRLGTDWGRNQKDLIWLDLAPIDHIITDIRFDNEAEYFKQKGYTIIEVVRKGQKTIEGSTHASEQGILQYLVDTVIYNDTTIRDLHEKAIVFVHHEDPIGVL